jgi:alkylated DNA repair dioxygenase AlkB
LYPDVFSQEEEKILIDKINKDDKKNECPQVHPAFEYGWKFLPIAKKKDSEYLGEMPEWLQKVWSVVTELENMPEEITKLKKPDHALLNIYEPGDGCTSHVDDVQFWKNWVVGVSFNSGTNMNFIDKNNFTKTRTYWIPPRSVYLLEKQARYDWNHSIGFDTADMCHGEIIERSKRYSITFRSIHDDFLSDDLRNSN